MKNLRFSKTSLETIFSKQQPCDEELSHFDWLCTGEGLTRHPETMRRRYRAALKAHHYAKYCARFYAK
jgi:hypothetical protein